MVRCEEEENGENGERGGVSRATVKMEGRSSNVFVKEGGRVCLVEGK